MASSLGQAFLAIVPKLDSSAMTSACDSINTGLSKVGEVGEKAFKAVEAAAAAGVAALAGVTTAAVSGYSAYEQNIGGVQKLFGDAADTVAQNAANAYKTAGMSANQYMEQATSFSAALINSLGGDTEAAAQQADVAMRAMSDNVNTFGSDMTDVQNAFQGFAKQNYTMLDNLKLGYGGTKEEMERLISDANEYAAANGEAADLSIDSFSDIVTAIELVQEKQNIAGTTAREAATTLEGSLNMLKASWTNWLTELGKDDADMGALTEQLMESFTSAASNLIPRIAFIVGTFLGEVPQLIADYAPKIGQSLNDMLADSVNYVTDLSGFDFNSIFEGAEEAVQSFVSALTGGGGLQEFAETAQGLVAPAMETLQSAAALVAPVLEGIGTAISNIASYAAETLLPAIQDNLLPVLQQFFDALQPWIEPLTNVATLIGNTLVTAITMAVNAISGIIGFVAEFLNGVMTLDAGVSSAVSSIAAWFGQLPATIGGFLSSVIGTIAGFVGSVISSAASAGSGFLSAISDGFNSAVAFVSGIPGQIVSAIGNVGSLLYNAGSSIIDGLMNGIKDTISGVFSFVSGIADTIASLKGPLPYDRKVLIPNGMALMESLESGLRKGFPAVESLVSGMADTLASDMSVSPTLESKGSVYGTVTVASAKQADTGILSKLESIAAKLEERETAVYVDGKKLASTIAKPMNQQLGRLAARGV